MKGEEMSSSAITGNEKAIRKEIAVNAPIDDVWDAWTTPEGIRSFFARGCNLDIRANGPYEILFDPDAEPDRRGAEGCHVLAVQPKTLLSFTWSAPPQYPDVRKQRTSVIVRLEAVSNEETKVVLVQIGWGDGAQWDDVYKYFDTAWDIVLHRLKYRFDAGPVDWSDPPRP
jgi:uncharacterized protein YndB with AHSA1/START domain